MNEPVELLGLQVHDAEDLADYTDNYGHSHQHLLAFVNRDDNDDADDADDADDDDDDDDNNGRDGYVTETTNQWFIIQYFLPDTNKFNFIHGIFHETDVELLTKDRNQIDFNVLHGDEVRLRYKRNVDKYTIGWILHWNDPYDYVQIVLQLITRRIFRYAFHRPYALESELEYQLAIIRYELCAHKYAYEIIPRKYINFDLASPFGDIVGTINDGKNGNRKVIVVKTGREKRECYIYMNWIRDNAHVIAMSGDRTPRPIPPKGLAPTMENIWLNVLSLRDNPPNRYELDYLEERRMLQRSLSDRELKTFQSLRSFAERRFRRLAKKYYLTYCRSVMTNMDYD